MARSSVNDPIEKFRFLVTVFDNVLDIVTKGEGLQGISTTQGLLTSNLAVDIDKSTLGRAGFSKVTIPKATVKDIYYRENTQGNAGIKQPGLVTYEPVILTRGVTKSFNLYNWYKQVNDDTLSLNKFQDTLAGLSILPVQNPNFRREVLISALDRTGKFSKHWLLYNAWPKDYKGANDFDSNVSEILLEEITLVYENFLELSGDTVEDALKSAASQAAQSVKEAGIIGAISGSLGFLNKIF